MDQAYATSSTSASPLTQAKSKSSAPSYAKTSIKSFRPVFSVEQRENLLSQISQGLNIEIVRVEGLLSDYVQERKIDFFIRGIRSYSDFDSEFTMGLMNRRLCEKETVFLLAEPSRVHVSSSIIRELSMFGRSLDNFVPPQIE